MDFVLIWVDGNDNQWQNEKARYTSDTAGDKSSARFRDWELLKYWFRGVEKFAPWIDKVHFVTCGHFPKWLNLNHPKLNFVKHSDFIPTEYLPTFNSHTIELNLHRIQGLAEEFVYFNDDMFLISNTKPSNFFKNYLPCDEANIRYKLPHHFSLVKSVDFYNLWTLAKHFKKNKCLSKNPTKYINLRYSLFDNLYTLYALPAPIFPGFTWHHSAQSFLKSTFEDVWVKEPELLEKTCKSKFREATKVSQYLIRYWQLAQGNFSPCNFSKSRIRCELGTTPIEEIGEIIRQQNKQIICINDDFNIDQYYELYKISLIKSFEMILPEKSTFEIV